ncbi:hypothetical protein ANAPC5_01219 [Anaplasma phagocytophilum]|nr:hypothetical protein ANAPC5_01219 [Anaplasma phagocytophilum]
MGLNELGVSGALPDFGMGTATASLHSLGTSDVRQTSLKRARSCGSEPSSRFRRAWAVMPSGPGAVRRRGAALSACLSSCSSKSASGAVILGNVGGSNVHHRGGGVPGAGGLGAANKESTSRLASSAGERWSDAARH